MLENNMFITSIHVDSAPKLQHKNCISFKMLSR